jgi:hypothetical protein
MSGEIAFGQDYLGYALITAENTGAKGSFEFIDPTRSRIGIGGIVQSCLDNCANCPMRA